LCLGAAIGAAAPFARLPAWKTGMLVALAPAAGVVAFVRGSLALHRMPATSSAPA
jgi:hypothetical protein